MDNSSQKKDLRIGIVFFSCFFILIISGIVAKRLYGHPDWMVFFHLPAAVFLVMSWSRLSYKVREKYCEALEKLPDKN